MPTPTQEQEAGAARPSLQVLERAFAILEAFTEFRPEWSTSDLARFLELPIPTVHRLLGALARLGYVSRDEQTRRFRLGGAAMQLGERARAVSDLRAVALLPLRRLSEVTDETAVLTVLSHERDRSVCLERVESSQPLRLSVQPGSELPLHAGASPEGAAGVHARARGRPAARRAAGAAVHRHDHRPGGAAARSGGDP